MQSLAAVNQPYAIFFCLSVNSVDLPFGDQIVHVTLVPNPSHLEASCNLQLSVWITIFPLMQPNGSNKF